MGLRIILQAQEVTDKVKREVEKVLHATFRPEFLNRIDAIVFFKMLTKADVEKIAHLQLAELEKRLAERDINITFTQKAISAIADIGYEPEFGARPLKRAIQQYIATPIAQELLKRAAKRSISVDYKNDKFIIE